MGLTMLIDKLHSNGFAQIRRNTFLNIWPVLIGLPYHWCTRILRPSKVDLAEHDTMWQLDKLVRAKAVEVPAQIKANQT
jgi:hypothetical protein